MKKGISHFYGYNLDKDLRTGFIKEIGFDSVITNQDPRFNDSNGTIEEQIQIFKKYGIEISSLHNQYKQSELPNFWIDNPVGDKLEKTLKFDIDTAARYNIKCVVVHMEGEYSEFGEKRLLRILDYCREKNVALAVENIDCKRPFKDIFEKNDHPNLRFCYDSGHNNCFDPEIDYLEKYGDKLICLHLHDNNGLEDEHTLNKFGTIDWDKIARELAKLNTDNLVLDYEMIMCAHKDEVSADECLRETYRQACELEKMIEYYKGIK